MIPLFKTHYSIGKSILKIDDIVEIQKTANLSTIVCVEDSFYGFRSLNQAIQESNAKLIFGIRLPVVQNNTEELSSKLIFFAKNDKGITQIKDLYTKCYCSDKSILILDEIEVNSVDNVTIAVPFYDSFIYNNIFHFGMSYVNLSKFDYFYFYENNNHPFDHMIFEQVEKIANSENKNLVLSKSIFYKNKDDFDAFQMYKAVCNRSQGKSPNFGNPNLNHFSSNEFCFESYEDASL